MTSMTGSIPGWLSETQLRHEVELWSYASRKVQRQNGHLPDETRIYLILRCITGRAGDRCG